MGPVLAIIVFAILGVGIVFWWLRRLATQSADSMRARFPNAHIVAPGALFYGQESKGKAQLRGNGTLVVTDGEIIFERWVPKAEYRIRVEDITTIDTPHSFLGKSNGRQLLRVDYAGVNGQADAMAWLVSDLVGVKAAVELAREAHQPAGVK